MVSLLLVVFALQLFIHVLNTVGANKINDLVRRLSTSALRSEVLTFPAMAHLHQTPNTAIATGRLESFPP